MLSMSGYADPSGSDFGSFYISFTDPGRDDLAGDYGAIASEQYTLSDSWGNSYFNTESTYQFVFDSNAFGPGIGAWLLDGYQGAGDFASDGANRTMMTVLEAGWAESPVPEPGTLLLAFTAAGCLVLRRRISTGSAASATCS
jgi:hypothetical protein